MLRPAWSVLAACRLGGVMGFACASIGGGTRVLGQSVEFRFVERQGQQAIVTPVGTTATTDAVLNFAVQARVVGGGPTQGLGNFAFDIVIAGEPDANGTLAKMLISNVNGTYAINTAQTLNATTGRGGMAAPYTYLAGISGGFFNGLINTSGGTFTNGPDQEIFAITGSPTGQGLLNVTDADGDGNPDTYTGPLPVPANARADVDSMVAAAYFGAGGKWMDLYRFRYTVSNTATPRVLHVGMGFRSAQVMSELVLSNGVWGPVQVNAPSSWTGLDVPIGGTMACCDTATGACSVVDGTRCGNGTFAASGSCQPSPCPVVGSCCVSGGACTTGVPSACAGVYTPGGTCSPNICQQPVACCDASGVCTVTATCTTGIAALSGVCQPNPCAQPGACCQGGGVCTVVVRAECLDLWTAGACSAAVCRSGACCATGQACVVTLATGCTSAWTGGATCGTVVCPGTGACCAGSSCFIRAAADCGGTLQYRGDGAACLPAGSFNSCCRANFDGVNGVQVADLFAFLEAWFAGNIRADVDQSGSLTVQDIFSFVTIWWGGC